MTPDTFVDTFTLVRNSLDKQATQLSEVFPTEKRAAIAFRISHQRCSMKNGIRPATLLKKRLLRWRFPVNFTKFLRTPFLHNTSGRLLLCFMVFIDREFLLLRFKNICYCKIDYSKHYRLPKCFIKFPRALSRTAKAIDTFKEATNCKTPQAVAAIWAPGTDFS